MTSLQNDGGSTIWRNAENAPERKVAPSSGLIIGAFMQTYHDAIVILAPSRYKIQDTRYKNLYLKSSFKQ